MIEKGKINWAYCKRINMINACPHTTPKKPAFSGKSSDRPEKRECPRYGEDQGLIVLGSPFGELTAALEVKRLLGKKADVTVVSDDDRFG
jgi:hypothetical protein